MRSRECALATDDTSHGYEWLVLRQAVGDGASGETPSPSAVKRENLPFSTASGRGRIFKIMYAAESSFGELFGARGGIPQLDRVVETGRRDPLPVREEGTSLHQRKKT